MVQAGIDGLLDQTRTIEKIVAVLRPRVLAKARTAPTIRRKCSSERRRRVRLSALALAALPGVVLLGAIPAPARAATQSASSGHYGLHQASAGRHFLGRHRDQPHDLHPRCLLGAVGVQERAGFEIGNGILPAEWVIAPASTQAVRLGPLHTAAAPANCHLKDGRGHPPAGPDDTAASIPAPRSRPRSDAEWSSSQATGARSPPVGRTSRSRASCPKVGWVIDSQDVPVELAGASGI